MRRTLASRKGQSLIEFAFVLPLLLALTIGMIEFGFFLYNQQVITNASREGARKGIISRTERVPEGLPTDGAGVDSIRSVVNEYCLNRLVTFGPSGALRTTAPHDVHALFGTDLTVRVEYDYYFILFSHTPTTLVAQTVMKYE